MTYTKKDITRIIPGLKPNQIKYYVEQGTISPTKDVAGTGHYRQFSKQNVIEFAIIFEMLKLRLPSSLIKSVIKEIIEDAECAEKHNIPFEQFLTRSQGRFPYGVVLCEEFIEDVALKLVEQGDENPGRRQLKEGTLHITLVCSDTLKIGEWAKGSFIYIDVSGTVSNLNFD